MLKADQTTYKNIVARAAQSTGKEEWLVQNFSLNVGAWVVSLIQGDGL